MRHPQCPPPPGVTLPRRAPDFGYEPINLDDDPDFQTPQALREAGEKFRRAAMELRQAADAMEKLGDYCDRKARAMEARSAGRIAEALGYENFADAIYRRLPEWAKW